MVLLLNLIPILIFLLGALSFWKWKNPWIVITTGAIIILYMMAQPSYMPKGEVKRTQVPAFETKDIEMQDRLLRPPTSEELYERKDRLIKEGLPFEDPTK